MDGSKIWGGGRAPHSSSSRRSQVSQRQNTDRHPIRKIRGRREDPKAPQLFLFGGTGNCMRGRMTREASHICPPFFHLAEGRSAPLREYSTQFLSCLSVVFSVSGLGLRYLFFIFQRTRTIWIFVPCCSLYLHSLLVTFSEPRSERKATPAVVLVHSPSSPPSHTPLLSAALTTHATSHTTHPGPHRHNEEKQCACDNSNQQQLNSTHTTMGYSSCRWVGNVTRYFFGYYCCPVVGYPKQNSASYNSTIVSGAVGEVIFFPSVTSSSSSWLMSYGIRQPGKDVPTGTYSSITSSTRYLQLCSSSRNPGPNPSGADTWK